MSSFNHPIRRPGPVLRCLAALIVVTLVGCATTGSSGSGTPYPGMEAEFIPDRRPLRSSTDLLAFAETLPIYQSGDSKGWVRPTEDGSWLARPEGVANPVQIQRLPRAGSGAQRIKVMIGPSPNSKIIPPPVWIYELERAKGGWKQSF